MTRIIADHADAEDHTNYARAITVEHIADKMRQKAADIAADLTEYAALAERAAVLASWVDTDTLDTTRRAMTDATEARYRWTETASGRLDELDADVRGWITAEDRKAHRRGVA